MGQTPREIESYIENTREDLGNNLEELEQKVKNATDWKQHFRSNPAPMLGAAFGGGVLLAAMMGAPKTPRAYSNTFSSSNPDPGTTYQRQKAQETWSNIKGALIGVATNQVKNFVGEMVPGFHEQFRRTEENRRQRAV